jgi:hypothetical protein
VAVAVYLSLQRTELGVCTVRDANFHYRKFLSLKILQNPQNEEEIPSIYGLRCSCAEKNPQIHHSAPRIQFRAPCFVRLSAILRVHLDLGSLGLLWPCVPTSVDIHCVSCVCGGTKGSSSTTP